MGTTDLSLLTLFVAVAETSNFSRAAERVGMPKSSVSRGVARLEAILGQQLFYRTTRRVTLTTAGKVLYERAASHLVALRQAMGTLSEQPEPLSGTLRVTAPNDLGIGFLADLVARFCARYPEIRVEVGLTIRSVDLVGEGFDVALRVAGRLRDSTLVIRKVSRVEGQLFASPGYLERWGTPRELSELADHATVRHREVDREIRRRDRMGLSPKGLRPRILADDYLFVRDVVRADGGIGLLPSFLAWDDLAAGTLVRVLPEFWVPQGTLYLVHPAARIVPRKVVAFRDFVLERLATRPLAPRG
jgi:DNA-binding transcriptional LysR family regulator